MSYFYGSEVEKYVITVPKVEFAPQKFLQMYLLRENISRNNRSQEIFFVNGRLIKSQALSMSLEQGYHTLLAKGRFPIAVVMLDLPGEQIDVNIHPSKLEIKIDDFDTVKNAIVEYTGDALWQASISKNAFLLEDYRPADNSAEGYVALFPAKNELSDSAFNIENEEKNKTEYASLEEIKQKILAKEVILPNEMPKQEQSLPNDLPEKPLDLPKTLFATDEVQGKSKTEQIATFKTKPKEIVQVKDIDGLTLLGQLNNSFILAQNKEGLYIIDQHTLHERILYEKFLKEAEEKQIVSEGLLIPVTFNLTPKQEAVFIQCVITLRDLGFVIEEFGDRSYLLRAVPQGLAQSDELAQLVVDVIEDLGEEKNISISRLKEAVINQAACKAAVKARQKLDEKEMLALLSQLNLVANAHTCPHGRSIFYKISIGTA